MSEVALQFIFESLCYFAQIDETNARQMTLTYIDRGLLTDNQIIAISNILGSTINNQETSENTNNNIETNN